MQLIASIVSFEFFASALLAAAIVTAAFIAFSEVKNVAHRGPLADDDDYDWDI